MADLANPAPGAAPRERLAAAALYLCTDARRAQGDLAEFLDAALRGGVDIVQLREKGLEARQELAYAEVFADALRGVLNAPDVAPRSEPLLAPPRYGSAYRTPVALDPAAIGASLGLPSVAPFTLVALGQVPRGALPIPARDLPRPPNNHLMYAFTWFGIAGALLAVFAAYCRNALRRETSPP